MRRFAWIAFACALAACASDPPNRIVPGHEGAPGVHRVLLCPPNLVLALHSEIQGGADAIDQEIVAYLESRPLEVTRLGFIEGRQHWKLAVGEAKAAGAIGNAAALFVGRLAQEHTFDAVVVPSLILHQTQMDANNATWDGVTRRMKIVNGPQLGIGRDDSDFTKGTAYGGIDGPAWVTSLHVIVFDAKGLKVFEGRGGIDFVHTVDMLDAGVGGHYEMRPSTSLFSDRAILQEGIARAFEPYLPAPVE